ncbi:DegV family protein [Calidithermus chliarophilus]|uniref:DegV family protein n=1 Tax=Calidithermus chliarophilus TaxID=52023 RepID=UPI0004073348|nr:DegV family protein [Calidithermus chliarophilus]
MKTAFVADSTIGLTPEQAEAQGVYLIPQQVIVEGKAFRDHVEIRLEQVVQAQLGGKKVSTSQPLPQDYEALYERLLGAFDRIVSVHVSSKLSGTVSTAKAVAQRFGERVKVLDSLSVNGGLHFVLEEARRKLAQGVPWEGLEAAVAPLLPKIRGYVLPATLTYLHRGGRIGGLQHFVGSLLKILPILEVYGGTVQPRERVRGYHKGLERMAELLHKDYPGGARVILAHSENPQAVETLRGLIRQEGVVVEGVRECGAAVAAHTGPGTSAIFAGPR